MENKFNEFIENNVQNQNDEEYFDYLEDQNAFLDSIVDGEMWVDFEDIDDLMDRYMFF